MGDSSLASAKEPVSIGQSEAAYHAETSQRPRRQPTVVVRPSHGWAALNLRELWDYRDLLFILAARDVKLRYKQTALGIIWVVLQPLVAAVIFAVIFGRFAALPSNGVPYLLLALSGLLVWNYISNALQRAGNSLVADARLISKVYFPRLLIPLASIVSVLIDFAVTLVVLLIIMLVDHVMPTWRILMMPFFLLLAIMLALGASLWLSALNVKYRDFMYAIPFLLQVWMFASPVVYSVGIVPDRWKWLYALNPAVGLIEGFRWSLLRTNFLSTEMVVSTVCTTLLALIGGIFFFRRVERQFADII